MTRYGVDGDAVLLANLLDLGEHLDAPEGHLVCSEGGPPNAVWFLLSGRVHVTKRDVQGVERHLSDVAPPSMLGHMALINQHRRSATCRTLGPSVLRVLDVRTFKKAMNGRGAEYDLFRSLVTRVLARQLAAGNAELLDVLDGPAQVEIVDDEQTGDSMWSAEASFSGWSDHGED